MVTFPHANTNLQEQIFEFYHKVPISNHQIKPLVFPLSVDVGSISGEVCGSYFVLLSSRSKFISVPAHSSLMNVESPGGYATLLI